MNYKAKAGVVQLEERVSEQNDEQREPDGGQQVPRQRIVDTFWRVLELRPAVLPARVLREPEARRPEARRNTRQKMRSGVDDERWKRQH